MRSIYADYAATTPLYPGVLEAMLPWLGESFGNPSSVHSWGREARAAIDASRDVIASALGCLSGEIIFTSSATEAANLGIVGLA
ncbi:MAG: aminotransferase class V-fold PLP-dependent enzyme, partial [Candidatus Nitrosotenuis sp.]